MSEEESKKRKLQQETQSVEDATLIKKQKKEKKEKKHKDKKDKKHKKEKKEKKEKQEKELKHEKKHKKDKKDKKHKIEEGKDSVKPIEDSVPEPTSSEQKEQKEQKGQKTSEYIESQELKSVPQSEIDNYLKDNEATIEDDIKPTLRPILKFSQLTCLDSKISRVVSQFQKPTPIQALSWPYLLMHRDVIGVAETGSGKTFAFAVPAINHVVHQLKNKDRKGKKSSNVQVLVVSPTRELAMQTFDNMKTLTDATGLVSTCIYGGVPKYQQKSDLKIANAVVATPGRLLDLMEEGAADLSQVDYLVLDEADRMLEKGFEEDIKRIIKATKSEGRQTLMFTATWPPQVRDLANSFMNNPTKVSIGNRDELSANKRIKQIVEVVDPRTKENRLFQLLKQYQSGSHQDDKILIFALYKKEATRIERSLQYRGYDVAAVHGDLSQDQRTRALDRFKKGECKLLLATDVAARGLDIPAVKVVINLTFPLTVEDYVHRIGRTGRAGQSGIAHTLFTEQEKHLSGALCNVLRGANQEVPEELLKFGGHTKKKEHSVYGAFYKDVDTTKKAKKIIFD